MTTLILLAGLLFAVMGLLALFALWAMVAFALFALRLLAVGLALIVRVVVAIPAHRPPA